MKPYVPNFFTTLALLEPPLPFWVALTVLGPLEEEMVVTINNLPISFRNSFSFLIN